MASDPANPQVLANLRTEAEAQLLVNQLESIGIKALVSGSGPSSGWPKALGEVQVVVRQADLERALEVLNDLRKKNVNL